MKCTDFMKDIAVTYCVTGPKLANFEPPQVVYPHQIAAFVALLGSASLEKDSEPGSCKQNIS